MTLAAESPWNSLVDWIYATDEHAASRVVLLEEAERVLGGKATDSLDQRRHLADRLERWRYQHLRRRDGQLTAEDHRLLDALDLAACRLALLAECPPQAVREALTDSSGDAPQIARAIACLDPAIPLATLEREAVELTRKAFGLADSADEACRRWRMLLYAPLYVSNYCTNHCVYCGFRHPNAIARSHLTVEKSLREADVLLGRGFRHILLVAGDSPSMVTTDYLAKILRELVARGVTPAIEIAPQSTRDYAALASAGACGVTLYQETYCKELYAQYHPRGSKVAFDWRLEGLERAARAGFERLGLGVLLGLADPRHDVTSLLRHGRYLQSRFPKCTLAFSLPRIHETPEGFQVPYPIDDETFLRLYCVLRIAFPEAVLVLSTRERPALRNRLAQVCITQISAGSSTAPGGYEEGDTDRESGAQFPVCDPRSSKEVADWLAQSGFAVRWNLG